MRRITATIMITLLGALPLAGCLAEDDNIDTGEGTQDGSGTGDNETGNQTGGGGMGGGGAGGNQSGNGTGGGAGMDGNATWTYDNRTGDVSGLALPPVRQPSAEETFDVADGTLELSIDVGVAGDDLDIEIRPPDCTEAACADSTGAASAEGNFTASIQAPAVGTWTVYLASAGLGPRDSTYGIGIGTLSGGMAGAGNNTTG